MSFSQEPAIVNKDYRSAKHSPIVKNDEYFKEPFNINKHLPQIKTSSLHRYNLTQDFNE